MSACGYKRTLWGRALNFRSTLNSRHSNRHFRFRIVFVCFWGISGRMAGLSVESVVDPKAKSPDFAENIRICRRPAEILHKFLSAHLLVEHWASSPRALFRNNLVPLAYQRPDG